MDLNLHLVRQLTTVVDEGHFGRAAQRLFISAPALSQQVRKLERMLGVTLVDRSAHPVRPTPAGERFLAEAREALAAADRAVATVSAHRREQVTALRVGFIAPWTRPPLRLVLDHLRQEVPDAAVHLVELAWPQQASAVRDGIVDASLVRPPVTDTTGLRFEPVLLEPRVVALSAAHRLADRASVHIDELDDDPHVTDDQADPAWVHWWAADPRPSGAPVRYGPSVHTLDELLEVVAAGQAIAMTGGFVPDRYRHPEVAFVAVTGVEPCQMSLCTRAADGSPAVAALRRAAPLAARGGIPAPRGAQERPTLSTAR
ncbi:MULTISPECIES: LysR family transcriptional regulator [unclassified Modestobacter]|uniref:LysR substrate-binding domain-containing protein n=1 Tax=unclassified Modestobacter TaxID=2643866 RepID=UPI0022AAD161|nr:MULTISPECIES: LysR family transcriptional regulator [unclassified Modestobacter]MCZ2826184.1 LysR family transcriptional regulator [Modestobacter sp. VKM Ac-2981]MCZ2852751.1 LysR family transcriptional regulator [Modestobacter sp. VKM Ac-2982]